MTENEKNNTNSTIYVIDLGFLAISLLILPFGIVMLLGTIFFLITPASLADKTMYGLSGIISILIISLPFILLLRNKLEFTSDSIIHGSSYSAKIPMTIYSHNHIKNLILKNKRFHIKSDTLIPGSGHFYVRHNIETLSKKIDEYYTNHVGSTNAERRES